MVDGMEREEIEKESFSSKIRRRFGWKRKIILEKERKDGTGEVTIEVPAKHEGMNQNRSGKGGVDEPEKEVEEVDDNLNEIESRNNIDDCYIEVLTTLTTLFTPNYEENITNEDSEKVMFEDQLKCQNSDKILDVTEKLCDIPVLHVQKVVNQPLHHSPPSYSWLSTQSMFDDAKDTGRDVDTALREEIMDFEKEYKDVQEIVKKDHIKRSIAILLESSKSY